MIDTTIQIVTDSLNTYLKSEFDLTEDVVVLSNVLEQDGNVAPGVENKIAVFIINVEKDGMPARERATQWTPTGRMSMGFAPVYINVYLLFACIFTGRTYRESLKFLSETIQFFQRHPVWDHQNTPDLNPSLSKLCFDIVNLDIRDVSNLWGVISSRYMPSVIYKIRTFEFNSDGIQDRPFVAKDAKNKTVGVGK